MAVIGYDCGWLDLVGKGSVRRLNCDAWDRELKHEFSGRSIPGSASALRLHLSAGDDLHSER